MPTTPKPTARHYEKAMEEVEATAKALRDRWVADLEGLDTKRADLGDNVSHPDYPGRLEAALLAGIEEQNKTIATLEMVRAIADDHAAAAAYAKEKPK